MAQTQDTFYQYQSAHGTFTVGASDKGITRVAFRQDVFEGLHKPSALTNLAATQIQEYLAGKRTRFDVPLDIDGSAFQKSVWSEVASIPYAATRTPADIAAALGKPGAYRSVGTAIRQNRLAPLIPTHRVEMPNATGHTAKVFRALQKLEKANART